MTKSNQNSDDKLIIEKTLNKFDKEKIEASMKETPNCYGLCFTYGEVEENILPYALHLKEQEVRTNDSIFINHIQSHLKENEDVICKICGKTAIEIISKERVRGYAHQLAKDDKALTEITNQYINADKIEQALKDKEEYAQRKVQELWDDLKEWIIDTREVKEIKKRHNLK